MESISIYSFHNIKTITKILPALAVMLLLGFFTASAQTFNVQNGATVSVQNDGTLNLGSTTTLVENSGKVTGKGQVVAKRTLNAPSNKDVAGLGAAITSNQNLGVTTVIRSDTKQSIGNRESISRYYEINPTTNSGLDATLAFNYNDAQLNGLPEEDLTLFRSGDGGSTYTSAGYDSRDASTNTITLNGIDTFDRFSAAVPDLFNYGSLALNGIDNYLDISTVAGDIAGSTTFSVSLWVKPDFVNQTDAGGAALLGLNDVSGNDLFYILIGAPNTQDQMVRVFDSSGLPKITGSKLSGNTWHHITFTYDSGSATLYVDGLKAGQNSISVSLSSDDQWSIGQEFDNSSTSDFLDGNIDEVRIWDKALTSQQIRNNTFQPLSGNEMGLVGYYELNNTASGSSSNANDATLKNSPSFERDAYPNGTFITGNEGWHMMSSPVSGATYATLLDTLWLQGISKGGDATAGTANLYNWDEANYQFKAIDDATVNIPASKGFIFYVYNDQNFDGTPDGFPKMIRTNQQHRSGNFSPGLSFTNQSDPSKEGWNLTGNPYGATIDWDAANGWTKKNLESSIYVWSDSANSGSGAYLTWNGKSGTLGNGLIAPWQSFWVKANASGPVLQFTDNVRAAGGNFFKEINSSDDNPVPQIKFELRQKGTKEKSHKKSSVIVMFDKQVKIGKDPMDAWKLRSLNTEYLSLYTTSSEGYALDINALPLKLENPLDINMAFKGSSLGGQYTLSWHPQALPKGMKITLKDTYTGKAIDLNGNGEYHFNIKGGNRTSNTVEEKGSKNVEGKAIKGDLTPPAHGPIPTVMKAKTANSRFILSFNPGEDNQSTTTTPNKITLDQNYPNPFNPETVIRYGVPEKTSVQLEVYDLLGRKVSTLVSGQQSPGHYEVNFDASRLASGMYIYRLKVGTQTLTKKMTLIK